MAEASPAKYIAEFIGTFMLVFTVGCNVLTGQPVWGGVSIACVLTVMIYALGSSSGANFNPAVSVALGITKALTGRSGMEWGEVAIYCVVQIIAGICAGGLYLGMFGKSFNLAPTAGHNVMQAGLAELLYTFMLCFVVLNVAASNKHGGKNQFYGLAIGFVIVAGAYSGGGVSMGCFNPAVAFGIDVASAYFGVKYCFIYTVFELVGAAGAAVAFKIVRPEGGKADEKYEGMSPSALLSEFLGAYFLVLTVGLNVMAKSPAGAWSIAASLMCMIYALGDVSGGKFNPAVSLAVFLSKADGHENIVRTLAEMASQIVGGVAAAFTYAAIYGGKAFPLGPGAGYGVSQALVAEVVFTFVLCAVVLCAAVHNNDGEGKKGPTVFFALAIGSCVTCGGNAIGAISGGSLNPAVSIALASAATLSHGTGSLFYAGLYCVAEIIGAGIAAGICMATVKAEKVEVEAPKV